MVKTLPCWDYLLNRWSVGLEYPDSGWGKYYRILGGDGGLWEIDRCTFRAGITKGLI